jgi:hypothetical protein
VSEKRSASEEVKSLEVAWTDAAVAATVGVGGGSATPEPASDAADPDESILPRPCAQYSH